MGMMTIPEFYGRRFGRRVRVVGALLLAASGILNMGMFLKAAALFVAALTGLSDPQAVKWVMTGLLAVSLADVSGFLRAALTD